MNEQLKEDAVEDKPDIFIYADHGEDGDRNYSDEYYFQGCFIDEDRIKIYINNLECIEIPKKIWDECNKSIKEQLRRAKK